MYMLSGRALDYNPRLRTMTCDSSSIMSLDQTPGDMAVFVRVVELKSFSAAAQDLELTPSGVSKIVGRLEARLGIRLLNRTTRKVAVTTEGETYFTECRQILARIMEAEAQLMRQRERPEGLLRVHCGLAFGVEQLVPLLPGFLHRYPGIRLDLSLSDSIVDLMTEGADLAIRIGGEPTPSLVARKICDLERIVKHPKSLLRPPFLCVSKVFVAPRCSVGLETFVTGAGA